MSQTLRKVVEQHQNQLFGLRPKQLRLITLLVSTILAVCLAVRAQDAFETAVDARNDQIFQERTRGEENVAESSSEGSVVQEIDELKALLKSMNKGDWEEEDSQTLEGCQCKSCGTSVSMKPFIEVDIIKPATFVEIDIQKCHKQCDEDNHCNNHCHDDHDCYKDCHKNCHKDCDCQEDDCHKCPPKYCETPALSGHCSAKTFTITSFHQLDKLKNNIDDGLECLFWAGKSPSKILEEKHVEDYFLRSFCPKFGHSEQCLWNEQNIINLNKSSCECGDSCQEQKYFFNKLQLQNGKKIEAPVKLEIPRGLRYGEYSDGGKVELTNLCKNVFDTCPSERDAQSSLRGVTPCKPDCFSPPCSCPKPSGCTGDITLPLQKWSRIIGTTSSNVIFLSKIMLKTKEGLETVAYYAHESNNCKYLDQFPKGSSIKNYKPFSFNYPCSGCVKQGNHHQFK